MLSPTALYQFANWLPMLHNVPWPAAQVGVSRKPKKVPGTVDGFELYKAVKQRSVIFVAGDEPLRTLFSAYSFAVSGGNFPSMGKTKGTQLFLGAFLG